VENKNPDDNGNFQTVKALAPGYPELEPLEYQYQFNRFGQVTYEKDYFGMETNYNYYSEAVPGNSDQTVSARQLEDTGGYLKEIISPINTHEFKSYDARGNLVDYSNSMDVKGHYESNEFDELESENVISTGSLSPMSYNAAYKHYKDGNLDWHETTFSSGGADVTRKSVYKYTPRKMLDNVDETITTPTDTKTITTDYGYDLNDNLNSISNGLDSMSFGYNDRDLVESVTLGAGANATSVSYTYDGNGNVLTVTDHYGHQTVFAYDGYDRLMQVTDPLSNMTLLNLFDKGNKLVIKNFDAQNLLRESIRIDDPLGRLKSYEVKLPGGGSESYQYTYTDGYKTITITDSLKRSWTYKKNEKGQVYFEQDPAGNFTNYYYEDAWGNITKKEEHEKLPDSTEEVHVTKYKYNSQGKIEEIRELMDEANPNQEDDEKDLITTFTYDTRGNLTGTRDAEGNKISHEYDGFNRKTLTKRYLKNGEEIKTSFTYYDNNLPKTITDDKGNITEYKFDDQKRLTKVIYPDLSYIEITYTKITKDEQDYKRVIITQRNGTIVTNDYDKLGRLVNRTIQKGENVEGTTFENFAYDGLNRLNYAENDNFVVEFKFDPLNRITEENKQADNEIANFKYIGRSYRLLSKQFGNGDAVNYLYDQGRRMTSKEAKNKNSDLITKYVYGYNKVHMKNYEQRMHENGIGDVFGYDAVYRLTNAKFNVPDPTAANPTDFERERNIFLDHVDNITRIDETKNGETSQITTEIPPDTDFSKLNQYSRFDNWGLVYDKNGNLAQKSTQKMYHDYRSQMVRVTEGTTTTENKYDALGRRLQMIVNTGSQAKTENYYYSGHQVIEVRDGSDQLKRQFIYGNGIDEVVRMDVYNGSTITPYYLHRNEIGSTTAVTDANGQVVERYKYGLYGMPTFMDAAGNVIPKSTIGNNILFQGREYEPETNFYYFRARHLDPIMGRFLSTDPMGYQDSLNLYQAFNMNPVNFTDPFGQSHVYPGVPGTSYGESKLYHEDDEYRRFVDGYYRGMGDTIFNPLTIATIGLTIINPAAGIAFGLGALTNTYYHSVKDRLEEGQSFGGALGGGVLDLTGVSDIQASGKAKDPYKSGESLGSGSVKLGTTAIAIVYGAKMGLSKLKNVSDAPKGGSTVKYNAKAKRFYDSKTGQFIKFKDVPWPEDYGFVNYKEGIATPGQIVDRYGSNRGKYLAPEDTPYEKRGIAEGYIEYHKYEVLKPFKWYEGYTAPAHEFGSPGGGYQYMLPERMSVQRLIKEGYLKEIK
jgi:RHS repeat-associated protein